MSTPSHELRHFQCIFASTVLQPNQLHGMRLTPMSRQQAVSNSSWLFVKIPPTEEARSDSFDFDAVAQGVLTGDDLTILPGCVWLFLDGSMVFAVKKKKNNLAPFERYCKVDLITYFTVGADARSLQARTLLLNALSRIGQAAFRVAQSVKIISKEAAAAKQKHKDNMDEIIDSLMQLKPEDEQKAIMLAKLVVKTKRKHEVSDRDMILANCEKNLEATRKIRKRVVAAMRHPAKIPCVATYDDLQPHLDAIKIYTIDS
jgi:hypothetical protein